MLFLFVSSFPPFEASPNSIASQAKTRQLVHHSPMTSHREQNTEHRCSLSVEYTNIPLCFRPSTIRRTVLRGHEYSTPPHVPCHKTTIAATHRFAASGTFNFSQSHTLSGLSFGSLSARGPVCVGHFAVVSLVFHPGRCVAPLVKTLPNVLRVTLRVLHFGRNKSFE